ncbi:hypothetical protein J4E08_12165 [Sagittula sp. NFXS13]|uniref:hypothetical protein n=1 Tax=Sagittula sp. NFXS13 TaxID=2819095 RepID=UPI0032DF94A5
MIRRTALPLLILGATSVHAADPAPEPEETSFTSAAVGGTFSNLPPSEYGFPQEVLGRMREALGGTAVPTALPQPDETPEDEH